MNRVKYYWKLARPLQTILGGAATWIVALLSNGPTWFSTEKVIAAVVMGIGISSSSIWHYGARSEVYAKKHWDPIIIENPQFLRILGGLGFISSIVLAYFFLPTICVAIAFINALVIALYGIKLDKVWPWKNLTIAAVCVTPLMMGWFSGHRLNPIVPSLIIAAFLVYLTREVLKDIVDREANQGKRFTMVMELGVTATLRIAGVLLMASTLFVFWSTRQAALSPDSRLVFALGAGFFALFSLGLLKGKNLSQQFKKIDIGVGLVLLGLLLVRVHLY